MRSIFQLIFLVIILQITVTTSHLIHSNPLEVPEVDDFVKVCRISGRVSINIYILKNYCQYVIMSNILTVFES